MAVTGQPVSISQSTIGRLRLGRVTPRMLGAASAVAISTAGLPAVAQQAAPTQLPAISVEGQKPAEDGQTPPVEEDIGQGAEG